MVLSWSSFFCLSCTSLSTHALYILAVIVKTAHFRHSLLSSAHPRFICPEQQQPSWFLSLFIIPHINMTMWDSNYVITDVAVLTLQQCSFLPLLSFYKSPSASHCSESSAISFSLQQSCSSYRCQLRSMSLFGFFQNIFLVWSSYFCTLRGWNSPLYLQQRFLQFWFQADLAASGSLTSFHMKGLQTDVRHSHQNYYIKKDEWKKNLHEKNVI